MPSSAEKRREQQRARRAHAAEAASSGQGGVDGAGGVPLPVPLPQASAEPHASDSEPTPSATTHATSVASALFDADITAAKILQQLGEQPTPAGLRAIAAVLYERQHGGTFKELAALFTVDGASFNRDTLRKWRALMGDVDRPEAFVECLEREEARRQRNAENNAAFRAGSTAPRPQQARQSAASSVEPSTAPSAQSTSAVAARSSAAPLSAEPPLSAPPPVLEMEPPLEPVADEHVLAMDPLQPVPMELCRLSQPALLQAEPATSALPANIPPSPQSPLPPPLPPPPKPQPPQPARPQQPSSRPSKQPFRLPTGARIDLSDVAFWEREALLDPELQRRRDRHRRSSTSAPSPEPLLPLDPEDAYMLYEPTMVTRGVFEHERKREAIDHGQWKPYSQQSPSPSRRHLHRQSVSLSVD
jgi:hypothetical protein